MKPAGKGCIYLILDALLALDSVLFISYMAGESWGLPTGITITTVTILIVLILIYSAYVDSIESKIDNDDNNNDKGAFNG